MAQRTTPTVTDAEQPYPKGLTANMQRPARLQRLSAVVSKRANRVQTQHQIDLDQRATMALASQCVLQNADRIKVVVQDSVEIDNHPPEHRETLRAACYLEFLDCVDSLDQAQELMQELSLRSPYTNLATREWVAEQMAVVLADFEMLTRALEAVAFKQGTTLDAIAQTTVDPSVIPKSLKGTKAEARIHDLFTEHNAEVFGLTDPNN